MSRHELRILAGSVIILWVGLFIGLNLRNATSFEHYGVRVWYPRERMKAAWSQPLHCVSKADSPFWALPNILCFDSEAEADDYLTHHRPH